MSATVLATLTKEKSYILGAQAIEKSYPNFFKDYVKLGGKVDGDI